MDRLDRLSEIISIARRTRSIALQSVLAGIGMSLVAMAAAGVGLLPAVWGALLQEGIDVAVILNALRALRPPTAVVRVRAADAELTRRYAGEHKKIRADIEELRAAADSLGFTSPETSLTRARHVHNLLLAEVVPHENAEEHELYPALDRMLGSPEATAAMSCGHAEIAHQIRRLGQLLDDIGAGPPDEADLADLRGLLYGLHAILRLHTTQEDESYLCLAEDADRA